VLLSLSLNAIHDRLTEGRIHPVSVWVPIAMFVLFNVATLVVQPSAAWIRFAEWLVGMKQPG
jgi:uncharacterized membrane protein